MTPLAAIDGDIGHIRSIAVDMGGDSRKTPFAPS
jgi:hypothetical protein